MFDIAFSELIVIGAVALVVVGPERLPRVARTAGHLIGRMQRFAQDVRSSIDREIQMDELRKIEGEIKGEVQSLQDSVRQETRALEAELPRADEFVPTITEAPTAAYLREPPQEIARNEVKRVMPDE